MSFSFAITGMYRSGTTLVEKWLNSQQRCTVYSQPFPYLFYEAKRSFYKENRIDDPIPLGGLFPRKYSEEQREMFLKDFLFDEGLQQQILEQNASYSGCMTKAAHHLQPSERKSLYHLLLHWVQQLDVSLGKDGKDLTGFKEVVIEEFIPHLLSHELRIILVIRNPLDVLVSLNYGSGNEFTGGIRPTLFNIRQWRKSVAYALHYKDHPGVMVVRYEDFLSNTNSRNALCRFLGIEMTHASLTDLHESDGTSWKSNSSFSGSAKPKLPSEVEEYIVTLARAELRAMGYTAAFKESFDQIIEGFREPWQVMNRPYLPPQYSVSPGHIEEELKRLAYLKGSHDRIQIEDWFIFDDVITELKKHV